MELLGRGRCAEVFLQEDGKALKLFYDGGAAAAEAVKAAVVGRSCPMAPAFYGRTERDGRSGLLYACVAGASLKDQVLSGALGADGGGRHMADLHRRIHACSGEGLPSALEYFGPRIERFPLLSAAGRGRLLDYIARDAARGLCHGDLHPDNILIDVDGRVWAIDWANAYRGNPLGDAARTEYLLLNGLPPGAAGIGDEEGRMRAQAAQAYMSSLNLEFDPQAWDLWRLAMLVGRYGEGAEAEAPVLREAVGQIAARHGDFA